MERHERQPFRRSLEGDKKWVSFLFLVVDIFISELKARVFLFVLSAVLIILWNSFSATLVKSLNQSGTLIIESVSQVGQHKVNLGPVFTETLFYGAFYPF